MTSSSPQFSILFLLLLLLCYFPSSIISGSALSKNQSHRVIGGESGIHGPHYARLIGYNRDYTTFNLGSGTFISLKHILTSASFVAPDINRVTVQYGATDLESLEEKTYYPTIISHPMYNAQTFESDLAIIVLPVEIEHPSVHPARLMRVESQPENSVGDVFGFGWQPDGNRWVESVARLSFQSSWISDESCKDILADRAELKTWSHFCARDIFGVASVCHGDSGAGYVMYINAQHYLTGVLSVFTNMCNPHFPAMYTRVAPFVDWIDGIMEDGARV